MFKPDIVAHVPGVVTTSSLLHIFESIFLFGCPLPTVTLRFLSAHCVRMLILTRSKCNASENKVTVLLGCVCVLTANILSLFMLVED